MIEIEYRANSYGKRYPIRMLGGVYRAKIKGNIKVLIEDKIYYPLWFRDDSSEYKIEEIFVGCHKIIERNGYLEYKGKFGFDEFKDTYDMDTKHDIVSDLIDKYFIMWIEDIRLEGCKLDWYAKDRSSFGFMWLRAIINENK